jgi:hypothetical protein
MQLHRFVQAAIVVLLAALPSSIWAAPWSPPKVLLESVPGASPASNPAVVLVAGQLSMVHVDSRGRVVFRQGNRVQTLDDEAPSPGGKNFHLHYDGRHLYALWWVKRREGKRLYLRASEDGGQTFAPLVIVNTGTGVLPDLDIAADGAGRIAVAYVDERRPGYQIYVNRSVDGGKTWLAEDIRLDSSPGGNTQAHQETQGEPAKTPIPVALTPRLTFQGDHLLAVWQQQDIIEGDRNLRWVARISENGGESWSPEVEIFRAAQSNPTGLVLVNHQDENYVIGFVPGKGLLTFRSRDGGHTRHSLGNLPGSADTEVISTIKALASGDNVLVSYTVEPQRKKSQIYVASLSARSGEWQEAPWRLDRKEHELTKAGFAELATLADGSVIAVWEDYRHLRPAIYMDYSTDGGKSWLDEPRFLTEPGLYDARAPRLLLAKDRVLVVYDRIEILNRQPLRSALYQTLPYGLAIPSVPAGKALSLEEKAQRLKQRAEELWTLRTQDRFAETWGYFDPVYRSRLDKAQWLAGQGKLKFLDFSLGEPALNGSFGKIPIQVTLIFSMQPLGDRIQETSPPQEKNFTMQWGWFYDDWYMVPPPAFGKSHLRY